MRKSSNSRGLRWRTLLDLLDEYNAGKRNWSLALGELLWVVGVAGDQVLALKLVESATAGSVLERQGFLVFKSGELPTPFGDHRSIADPDFAGLGIEAVAEAEGEDFVAFVEEVMGIGFVLRIGMISREEVGEGIVPIKY